MLTPDVVTDTPISSGWGNEIRDRTTQVFVDVAERDAQWPGSVAPDGSQCVTLADDGLWTVRSSAWVPVSTGAAGGVRIIGWFGTSKSPADLPVSGLIPVDWDAPGRPATAFQCVVGDAMLYDPPDAAGDTNDGHAYQYVSTAAVPSAWIDVGTIRGPQGVQGPIGPEGISGPQGPPGADGQATLIVGSFGQVKLPADLPPNGQIPIDWDGPGRPSAPIAMGFGQSLIYEPIDPTDPLHHHLYQFVSGMVPEGWVDIGNVGGPPGEQGVEGPAGPQGIEGPQGPEGLPGVPGATGPEGPQGEAGQATIVVGSFGAIRTPTGLPPDGMIPVNWDGPGRPAVAHQMIVGESLFYEPTNTADPLYAHLFTYLSTTLDPDGWADLGLIQGPQGPTGPQGPAGAGSGVDLWDPATTYQPDDRAAWPPPPKADTWSALRVTTNEQPGTIVTVTDGFRFPGGGSPPLRGLTATSAVQDGDQFGFAVSVELDPAGYDPNEGAILVGFRAAAATGTGFWLRRQGTLLRWCNRNAPTQGVSVPLAAFDFATRPWIRVLQAPRNQAGSPVTFSDSADGVTWRVVQAATSMVGGTTGFGSDTWAIGCSGVDGDGPNYAGVLHRAYFALFTNPDAPIVSWDADTANADGTAAGWTLYPGTILTSNPKDDSPWRNGSDVVHRSGDTMRGDLTMTAGGRIIMDTGYVVTAGAVYIDAPGSLRLRGPDNANGVASPSVYFQRRDGRTVGELRGVQTGYNTSPEASVECWMSCGGYSYQRVWTTQVASPPNFRANGDVYARGVLLTSDLTIKERVAPIGDDIAHQLVAAMRPITYQFPNPLTGDDEFDAAHPPRQRYGLAAQTLSGTDLVVDNEGVLHVDLNGVVAALVAEVQRLAAIVDGATPP